MSREYGYDDLLDLGKKVSLLMVFALFLIIGVVLWNAHNEQKTITDVPLEIELLIAKSQS